LNRKAAAAHLTIAALLVFGACHDSAAPTAVTPSSSPPIVVPTSPSPIAPPSPTAGPVIQDGPFRFSPDMDPEGAVSVFQGDRMVINATGVAAANPGMSLRLVVDWGDGESDRAACGTCRVEHVYARTGRFVLEAVVDDGQSTAQARFAAGVTRHAVVNVVARPVGQAPSPGPAPMPVTCNYPIPAPVWLSHSDGQTVSGTITLECALPPGYPAACVQFMDFLATPGTNGCFGRSSRGPRFAVTWDTRSCPNGRIEVECAGGNASAWAAVIHLQVSN
jgi:hypothetical protein